MFVIGNIAFRMISTIRKHVQFKVPVDKYEELQKRDARLFVKEYLAKSDANMKHYKAYVNVFGEDGANNLVKQDMIIRMKHDDFIKK